LDEFPVLYQIFGVGVKKLIIEVHQSSWIYEKAIRMNITLSKADFKCFWYSHFASDIKNHNYYLMIVKQVFKINQFISRISASAGIFAKSEKAKEEGSETGSQAS